MCIAVPGIVVKITGAKATVDYNGNKVEARADLVPVKIGDKVLIHAGCILQVLSDFDGDMLMELMSEIEQEAQEAGE